MSNNSSLSVNAHVTFLGADLIGVFESGSKADTTGGKQATVTETKLLVMPTDAENNGIKLTEAISQINSLVDSFSPSKIEGGSLKPEDVKAKMEQFGLKIFENIGINLKQVFLYQDTKKTVVDGEQPKVDKSMEYAINVEITDVLTLPDDFKLFDIKSIGLAVWNTQNKKVLERMSIANIDTLLASM